MTKSCSNCRYFSIDASLNCKHPYAPCGDEHALKGWKPREGTDEAYVQELLDGVSLPSDTDITETNRKPITFPNDMTLLDYFAGQAISISPDRLGFEGIATWTYGLAEAMMAEKKRRSNGKEM